MKVAMDRALLEWLRSAVTYQEQLHIVAERLKGMITFLGAELHSGRLKLIPEGARTGEFETPCAKCLGDLLLFEAAENDISCVDDRFVNGSLIDDRRIPVTTVYDLLPSLIDRGVMSRERSWQLIHKFRLANLWFLPLEADEIVHQLLQAGISHSRVIETAELRVMRRYWAACAARLDLLQRGNPAAIPVDAAEVMFLITSRHAIGDALARVWAESKQSSEARLARCSWILDSLYLDSIGLRRSLGITGPAEMDRELAALDAVILINSGLMAMPVLAVGKACRWEEYAEWLWQTLLRERCSAEPQIVDDIAAQMARQFRRWSHSEEAKEHQPVGAVIYRIIQRLPEPFRQRLESDATLLTELGIETVRVVKVAGLQLEAAAYTTAVAVALEQGSSRLKALRTEEEVVIRRLASGGSTAIDVEIHSQRASTRIGNVFWGLLLSTVEERRNCLQASRTLFDLSDDEFEHFVQEALAISDGSDRMEFVMLAAQRSAPYFYWVLNNRLRSHEQILQSELLPMSVDCLVAFLGLDPQQVTGWNASTGLADEMASGLLGRMEWPRALARFGGLPIPIAATLEEAFLKTEIGVQKRAIHQLLRVSRSPVRRIHVLRLISRLQERVFSRLRGLLVRQILRDEGVAVGDSYRTVLRWASHEIAAAQGSRKWPRLLRILVAWAHADRLFGYPGSTADLIRLGESFGQPSGPASIVDLREDFEVGRDVSDPDVFDLKAFLLNGLGYAFEGAENSLDLESRRLLKRCMFAKEKLPAPSLWESPTKQVDRLSSFLHRDRLRDLEVVLGSELASGYSPEWRSNVLKEALDNLEGDPHEFLGWFAIAALFRDLPVAGQVEEKLAVCLGKVDLVALAERARSGEMNVLPLLPGRLAHLRQPNARQHISSELVRLGTWYASNHGTEEEVSLMVSLTIAHAYPVPAKNVSLAEFEATCIRPLAFPTSQGHFETMWNVSLRACRLTMGQPSGPC